MEIKLGSPEEIKKENGYTYLSVSVDTEKTENKLWFSVRDKFAGGLTRDRNDAFVMAVFFSALKSGCDIVSSAPVSRSLLISLNQTVIPLLVSKMNAFKHIRVIAEPIDDVKSADGTGMCWTGGVDSVYTLYRTENCNELRKATHLLVANHGGLEGEKRHEILYSMEKQFSLGIANETGMQVVAVDSNIQDIFPEDFLAAECYRNSSVALLLQGLWDTFYISSSYDTDSLCWMIENSGRYDYLLSRMFSTNSTQIHTIGADRKRIEKLKELGGYQIAKKYLHPCIYVTRDRNCGHCSKCVRTLAALKVLDEIEKYRGLFDVDDFNVRWDEHLAYIMVNDTDPFLKEIMDTLKEQGINIPDAAMQKKKTMQAICKVAGNNREMILNKFNMYSK